MKDQDLRILKKKYGENFARLCRDFFPTILEKEGKLLNIITQNFAESKLLYEDIKNENLMGAFKNYIYSLANETPAPVSSTDKNLKNPYDLMKEAGYSLFECQDVDQVKSFKKYWEKSEQLCTFIDPYRINHNHIFFAVKDNLDEIIREDFVRPSRQDEYGTSVICIQISKEKPNVISIKNRYNHAVRNPDATFSNDLDNIISGLTESFSEELQLSFEPLEEEFFLPSYITCEDGKQYKYNYLINGNYYCPDNIIITKTGKILRFNKDRYLLIDYFVLDLKENKIRLYDNFIYDGFVEEFKDISKIQVEKHSQNKIIVLSTHQNKETIKITLDKSNKIIKYSNPNLVKTSDCFLSHNIELKELNVPNLVKTGTDFLTANEAITELSAPKLVEAGNHFMSNNEFLNRLYLPNLVEAGEGFLNSNTALTKLSLPRLMRVRDDFLTLNDALVELSVPQLVEVGDYFLLYNEGLRRVDFPNLKIVGDMFLTYNENMRELSIKNVLVVGSGFMRNSSVENLYAPKLEKAGENFMDSNMRLREMYAPKLSSFGKGFISSCLYKLKILSMMPKIKSASESLNKDYIV